MLIEIENLFFYAGLSAFSGGAVLALLSAVKRGRGFFKAGVTAMFLGDCAFAVAIAFPKKAQAILTGMGITEFPLSALAAGIILGAVLIGIAAILFLRRRKVKKASPQESREADGQKPLQTNAQQGEDSSAKPIILKNAKRKADPALFSQAAQDCTQDASRTAGSFSARD